MQECRPTVRLHRGNGNSAPRCQVKQISHVEPHILEELLPFDLGDLGPGLLLHLPRLLRPGLLDGLEKLV
jgi:hypothetical protein